MRGIRKPKSLTTDQLLEALKEQEIESPAVKAKPDLPLQWQCLICRGHEFRKVRGVWNQMVGPGSHTEGDHYECTQCTVKFGSPHKFNAYDIKGLG